MSELDFIVCRCEEVSFAQLANTVRKHGCSSREAKLRTRAGMGACGGRTCRPLIEQIVAQAGGQEPAAAETDLPLKAQAPVRPMTFQEWGVSR
jgi:NAD(P)H-nitrite reductase large subunit